MAFPLRRPILVGGLGLTAGAWALNAIDPSFLNLADTAVWGLALLGPGMWLLKQRRQGTLDLTMVPPVDRTAVEQAINQVNARIDQLIAESQSITDPANAETIASVVVQLQSRLQELRSGMDRRNIGLAVAGRKAAGKTTLTKLLKSGILSSTASTTFLLPTQSLVSEVTDPEIDPEAEPETDPEVRKLNNSSEDIETADLILFLIAGDLTDSEFKAIEQLVRQKHRVLLVLNKQDRYLPEERPLILQQVRDRIKGLLSPEDVIAISAKPAPVIVRHQQADGSLQERTEQPEPDITALQQRVEAILSTQGQQLVMATLLRQVSALNVGVQIELNQLKRLKALPVIEQYQWIAAAAAFANPVPSLDLVATASVTAQLVVDLGKIYQQSFSLDQAKTVMGNLATQMVQLGLVEVATQAISPVLKSHALTYVAGGTIQGLSAAYLTRIAGLSLVEYFEECSMSLDGSSSSSLQIDRLVQKVKQVLQDNQRSVFLQSLVKQGIGRLMPQSNQKKEAIEIKAYVE
ncbi:YcjF family protein [Egbenema bharatensis]|uniref:YcjF family protein n=1 Tax=Egbenema bharatensis TaxID=3463334 RepID=UPI003A8C5B50